MAKQEPVTVRGFVEKAERGGFKVSLEGMDGDPIYCEPAGKLRKHKIFIVVGDYVEVELSPYDMQRGRISYRFRNRPEDYKDEADS